MCHVLILNIGNPSKNDCEYTTAIQLMNYTCICTISNVHLLRGELQILLTWLLHVYQLTHVICDFLGYIFRLLRNTGRYPTVQKRTTTILHLTCIYMRPSSMVMRRIKPLWGRLYNASLWKATVGSLTSQSKLGTYSS